MNRLYLSLLLCIFAGSSASVCAQEKAKSDSSEKASEAKKELTPLRVQVVFTEYEGEKKISSLPYTLLVNADSPRGPKASIRMGLRVPVPVSTASSGVPAQIQYVDVGTNLDGWASREESGRFVLHLSLERSSSYPSGGAAQKSLAAGASELLSTQLVIQQFRSEVDLVMRDGQTIQSTMASDPVSGRVSKVEVTLNILK
jgi:hypothetical protein